MNINVVPWVLACAGAAWFGLLAFRTGRNRVGAAVTGGLFSLVISTFVFGLGQAMSTPFSDDQRATNHLVWTALSVALIAGVAGAFSLWFWRKPLPPIPITEPPRNSPRTAEVPTTTPPLRPEEKPSKPSSGVK